MTFMPLICVFKLLKLTVTSLEVYNMTNLLILQIIIIL